MKYTVLRKDVVILNIVCISKKILLTAVFSASIEQQKDTKRQQQGICQIVIVLHNLEFHINDTLTF